MIHGAFIEVSCDNPKCTQSVMVEMQYKFDNYSGKSGKYEDDDRIIEAFLENYEGWFVDNGEHYCPLCGNEC